MATCHVPVCTTNLQILTVICCTHHHIHRMSRTPFLILNFLDFDVYVVVTPIFPANQRRCASSSKNVAILSLWSNDSANESPENVLRWFLSCHKTDFTCTTIKQFLTQCYKLFTILRTYMIWFPVLFDETQFQTIRVKTLWDACQILGEK